MILFLPDRMLGVLTRYLRFMGYDTKSAVSLTAGDSREDTVLLDIAKEEGRYLLTRDRELAERGKNYSAVLLKSDDVLCQVKQLFLAGLIDGSHSLGMQRCVVCNTSLRSASSDEINNTPYAPSEKKRAEIHVVPFVQEALLDRNTLFKYGKKA